jgi:NADH dehydrogenase
MPIDLFDLARNLKITRFTIDVLTQRLERLELPRDKKITFDYLVLAAGVQSSYFGHNEFAKYAPCLKTITDAQIIRSKILSAYELAESTDDDEERRRLMTFVLVGAGPTGVELAASIAQMAKTTLRANFRRIDPATTSIVLLDGAKRVLPSFAESSSMKAAQRARLRSSLICR